MAPCRLDGWEGEWKTTSELRSEGKLKRAPPKAWSFSFQRAAKGDGQYYKSCANPSHL